MRNLVVTVVIIAAVALALRAWVVAPFYVPSASMEPTLHGCPNCNDDHVLVQKLSYYFHDPRRGDIVVFDKPAHWHVRRQRADQARHRHAGDKLVLRNGRVYINGQKLDESYVKQVPARHPPGERQEPSWTVPKNRLFVMGDNRCDSEDSRQFGMVPDRQRGRRGVPHLLAGRAVRLALTRACRSRELSDPIPSVAGMTNVVERMAELEQPLPPVVLGSLSPSRAADFKSCPLLYRFRTIDRLPETPSRVAVRGTMVHSVLEQLFDLPKAERTLAAARRLLPEVWRELAAADPEVAALFGAGGHRRHRARRVAGVGGAAARQLLRARGPVAVRPRGT